MAREAKQIFEQSLTLTSNSEKQHFGQSKYIMRPVKWDSELEWGPILQRMVKKGLSGDVTGAEKWI